MTTKPNRYGLMAMAHMAEFLPARYAQIDDPDAYFLAVGEEVLREINEAMAAWERAQPSRPVDDGVRNMTRLGVEEMVLGELVLLTPEPDPTEPEVDESGAWIGPTPGMGEWIPVWGGGLTQQDWDEIDAETSEETSQAG